MGFRWEVGVAELAGGEGPLVGFEDVEPLELVQLLAGGEVGDEVKLLVGV